MAISSHNDFVFEVRRSQPELVSPAKATPHEFKQLSDIDDQSALRFQVPLIFFYAHNPCMEGRDPAKVIKTALSETLVFYYPFAGRLREGPGRKLFVECTGEGVLFIEADAEVTRLKCGGFILAIRLNHTMCYAFGLLQFITAITELARGAFAPSTHPVWQRALLNARDPPTVTFCHHEYDQVIDTNYMVPSLNDMAHRSIFFGPAEISTLRKTLPAHLNHCSSFDLIAACLWRTRTIALQPYPNEEMRLLCVVNLRFKSNNLPLGYYGNTFVLPAAVAAAGEISRNPLAYVVELVRKAKNEVTGEYMKSVADLMVTKERPNLSSARSLAVSDVTKSGFDKVDFGWGKPVYGGPAMGGVATVPGLTTFCVRFKNNKGEDGIVVPLSLPAQAMERFGVELDALFNTKLPNHVNNSKSPLIPSQL